MGKYLDLQTDIFSIFNSTSWKAQNIKTYPDNVIAIGNTNEFIRVSILPRQFGINVKSVSGIVIVDIFTAAGQGPKASAIIADKLDSYLVGKSVQTAAGRLTQFLNSSMDLRGLDRDNPSLFRAVYTIPFSHYGVQ